MYQGNSSGLGCDYDVKNDEISGSESLDGGAITLDNKVGWKLLWKQFSFWDGKCVILGSSSNMHLEMWF